MGMAVVDQLVDLYLDGLIPSPARMAALLAGDFFALADTRGGFGCVAEVWQVFASQFAQVIGAVRRKRCHIRRISVEGPLPAGLGGGDFVRNFILNPFAKICRLGWILRVTQCLHIQLILRAVGV